MEEMSYMFSFTLFHCRSFSPSIWLVVASISHFITAATKFSCCCFQLKDVSSSSSCIWVAMPVVRTDGRAGGRTVTWLPNFLGWPRMGRLLSFCYPWCSSRASRASASLWEVKKKEIWRVQFLHSRNEFLIITVCFFILFLATSLQLAWNDFENILCFSSMSRRTLFLLQIEKEWNITTTVCMIEMTFSLLQWKHKQVLDDKNHFVTIPVSVWSVQ